MSISHPCRVGRSIGFLYLPALTLAFTLARAANAADASEDVFTPVVVSPLSPQTRAIHGTDDTYHVVYELALANTKPVAATIENIDVLDGVDDSRTIASFSGKDVVARMRTLAPQPASDAVIEPNTARLFYVELTFKDAAGVPRSLQHRFRLTGAANPGPGQPKPLEYVAARVDIAHDEPLVIGPPLAGPRWVAVNGCCNHEIVHRGSVQSVNGALHDAQRFAIDWMRLDEQGHFVHGDASDVHNFTGYGEEVLAVADGKVVAMLNTLDDQPPGKLPNPSTITMQTVDGNHVVLDIGGGYFAFYAHLQKNSVAVHVGDQVKKGAIMAKLGNSGNTSAPHLHFHVMNSPSVLGSDGLPYLIDGFDFAGQIDLAVFEAAPGVEGEWGQGRLSRTEPRKRQFPLNLNIIDFPPAPANNSNEDRL